MQKASEGAQLNARADPLVVFWLGFFLCFSSTDVRQNIKQLEHQNVGQPVDTTGNMSDEIKTAKRKRSRPV